ncbi:MAG: hypothetical protein KA764_14620 [Anaerolineales bacterium]|nr:hypothetical protein [Anaerolineales bacterium]
MPPSKDQHGKPLICLTNGRQLGEVKDLYLDSQYTRVTAVFVRQEGLLNRKTFAVERGKIQVLGIDAWLVSTPDAVVELSAIGGADLFVAVGALRGRELHTEGGTKLATVDDVLLDADGVVIGFTLGKLFVQGPLAERKTIARAAITSFGGKDAPMLTSLAKAEAQDTPQA